MLHIAYPYSQPDHCTMCMSLCYSMSQVVKWKNWLPPWFLEIICICYTNRGISQYINCLLRQLFSTYWQPSQYQIIDFTCNRPLFWLDFVVNHLRNTWVFSKAFQWPRFASFVMRVSNKDLQVTLSIFYSARNKLAIFKEICTILAKVRKITAQTVAYQTVTIS